YLGWIHLENTPLAFLGATITPYLFTVAAIGELINDKLPKTPSRKAPPAFIARIVMGSLSGAALGAPADNLIGGPIAGLVGAIGGTMGGYNFRVGLVNATGGKDLPIALLEDAIAVFGAILIVSRG